MAPPAIPSSPRRSPSNSSSDSESSEWEKISASGYLSPPRSTSPLPSEDLSESGSSHVSSETESEAESDGDDEVVSCESEKGDVVNESETAPVLAQVESVPVPVSTRQNVTFGSSATTTGPAHGKLPVPNTSDTPLSPARRLPPRYTMPGLSLRQEEGTFPGLAVPVAPLSPRSFPEASRSPLRVRVAANRMPERGYAEPTESDYNAFLRYTNRNNSQSCSSNGPRRSPVPEAEGPAVAKLGWLLENLQGIVTKLGNRMEKMESRMEKDVMAQKGREARSDSQYRLGLRISQLEAQISEIQARYQQNPEATSTSVTSAVPAQETNETSTPAAAQTDQLPKGATSGDEEAPPAQPNTTTTSKKDCTKLRREPRVPPRDQVPVPEPKSEKEKPINSTPKSNPSSDTVENVPSSSKDSDERQENGGLTRRKHAGLYAIQVLMWVAYAASLLCGLMFIDWIESKRMFGPKSEFVYVIQYKTSQGEPTQQSPNTGK